MPWKRTDPAQVKAAVAALVAGETVKSAAQTAGITTGTLARWMAVGPPCDVPGIASKGTPLIISALRARRGADAAAPLDDGEQLFALRLAAKHLLRVTGDFIRAFGGGEGP